MRGEFLNSQFKRLEQDTLTMIEIPMKKLTVAISLIIFAVLLRWPDMWLFSVVRPITWLYASTIMILAFVILAICTVDTLTVDRISRNLKFTRKGLFQNETKSFRLSQIKELRMVRNSKEHSLGMLVTYKLQASLISSVHAELFRSYSPRILKKQVVLFLSLVPTFV